MDEKTKWSGEQTIKHFLTLEGQQHKNKYNTLNQSYIIITASTDAPIVTAKTQSFDVHSAMHAPTQFYFHNLF